MWLLDKEKYTERALLFIVRNVDYIAMLDLGYLGIHLYPLKFQPKIQIIACASNMNFIKTVKKTQAFD